MGSRLVYYLVILPISYLPYPLLYLFSDFCFLVMYYLVGYRKKVTGSNIRNAFPNKSSVEHEDIRRKFYRHFCDLVVETFKGFTISESQIRQRFKARNPEILDRFYEEGRSLVMVGGHFNNWEMLALGVGYYVKHFPIGIYKELHNKYFDAKMRATRERARLLMVPTYKTRECFDTDYGEPVAPIFGIDQSPSNTKRCYWLKFLNQDTAVSYGAEKYAKEYDRPVAYGVIHKVKRGHYELEIRIITENPVEEPYGAILEKSTKEIENDILANPEYWLWTHRRWKAKRPVAESQKPVVDKGPITDSQLPTNPTPP